MEKKVSFFVLLTMFVSSLVAIVIPPPEPVIVFGATSEPQYTKVSGSYFIVDDRKPILRSFDTPPEFLAWEELCRQEYLKYERVDYHTAETASDPCPDLSDELYLLSHLIEGEAGADWCSDTMQLYVGSVALNRVVSSYFPNTLYEVIYQSGQYACTWDGNFNKEPSQRSVDHAKYLLENGSVLPVNVVFQAEFSQGDGIYVQEQNMLFCYKN